MAVSLTAGASSTPAQSSSGELSSTAQPVPNPQGNLPFLHGVASGDPVPNTVILWTRVTPSAAAAPGSGLGPDVTLTWTVARDGELMDVVKQGHAVASAAHDHTVHVDPWGLEPDTEYFFRFTVTDGQHAGAVSPIGRTHTAPALSASVEEMNIAVASCANWESGFFSACSDVAARARSGDLDLMVFLGDYIYEYGRGEYSGFGPFRLLEPAHESVTLADYRTRYGLYRTDPELQAAHGALPWVVVWDDHEIADNNWRGGAANHQPETEGPWLTRRDAAMQAYFEWLPVRAISPSEGGHLYRSFQYGDLMELTMMDLRTYRDQTADLFDYAAVVDPARTMAGSEQFEWLRAKISTSSAVWNVLGSSVMLSPMNLVTLREDERTVPVAEFLSEHRVGASSGSSTGSSADVVRGGGVSLNPDQWDGYVAEQRRLVELLASSASKTLVLTGDIHTEWAHALSYEGREFGCELVTSSVSAPNVDEILGLPKGNALSQVAQEYLAAANPHLRHVELDSHGYAIARVGRDQVRMQFLRTPDVTRQGAGVVVAHEMVWRQDAGFE